MSRSSPMTPGNLDRFRQSLLNLRDRLDEAIGRMSETVRRDALPPGEHDWHVGESAETELLLEQDEESIRRQVHRALERLNAGSFGMCVQCGAPIGRARLEALPYTAFCIDCERTIESGAGSEPN